MEDDIDLRAYIAVLLDYKFWIAGLAIAAAAVALVVSFLMPPTYEATALVAIAKPRYEMQFDPRVETLSDVQPPYEAFLTLATGDELIADLIDELGDTLVPEERSVRKVRNMLEAKSAGGSSVVRLTVQNGDPTRTAAIANRWAERFVQSTNDLYGEDQQELSFFEAQMAEARDDLSQAEQALIDFQRENKAAILETQLHNKQAALSDYLGAARSLRLIVQDARSLRERLSTQDAGLRATLSDELAALYLEIDALNSGELPIQLQVSGEAGLDRKTVGEQIVFLDSLAAALQAKLVVLEDEGEALEPDILALQEALQRAQTEEDRLELARNVAQETYMTLARKVAEMRIAAEDETGDVRLASRASVPDRPVAPRKLLNTAVAGALGLFVGVFAAFAIEYWRSGKEAPSAE
jgi:uncharacterized protein involved in exopolysaccharide biosynthesis